MLNSLHLANNHYSLKLKSMFDLAIATQRHSHSTSPSHHHQQPPPPQVGYPIQHQQYPPPPPSHHHQQSKHLFGSTINSGPMATMMDDCGGVRDDGHLLYPRSPQSEASPKSRDSCVSPGATLESTAANLIRSDMSPSSVYNNNNNSLISGTHNHLQQHNMITQDLILSGEEKNGKQGGKKQGSGGVQSSTSTGPKPSFSIESLLAHSNNWRRHHPPNDQISGTCKAGSAKDTRFVPYSVPHQTQQHQQIQQQSRQQQSETSTSNKNTNATSSIADNDKRSDGIIVVGKSNTANANSRRATKSKRVRTIFTPEQLERLEAEFERQQYMVGPERLYLASSLYLTEAQVKVWFQNRRIKWRKQHLEMEQQRLAIYRTLAEQDMMASVEEDDPEDDSVDCDYDIDDSGGNGGDEERRSLHSPSQQQIGGNSSSSNNSNLSSTGHHQPHNHSQFSLTSSILDKVNPTDHPTSIHHGNLPPTSSPIRHIKPLFPNNNKTSGGSVSENRLRVPLQQTSTNEDYDNTSSSTTSSSSPQSTASFTRTCKDHPGSK